jgi:LuxR family glucitol operon transcriptional activator
MEKFGTLLHSFRKRCKDPDNPERQLSQEKFGELLKGDRTVSVSGAAVSDWERSVTRIHADQRATLLKIIEVLRKCGGIDDPADANTLLHAGNFRSLDPQEVLSIFLISSQEEAFSQNKAPQPPRLWPPGIPDEDYYSLPHREQQLKKLFELLKNNGAPQVISIDGLGGMGKTSLAAELARRCVKEGLFEGVIGETAKQEILSENEIIQLEAPILNYENLLDALARQLQLWDLFTRDVKSRETVLSQVLRRDRHLVLVDNLETIENANLLVARLGNILGTSRAIITSRVKVHFGFAHSFTLESLDLEDSILFIKSMATRLDVKQIQDTSIKTLEELWRLTGGSPLAMKLAVAQARFADLDHILKLMRGANNNLYFFIFKESWEQLSGTAQNILIYIGKTAIEAVGMQELLGIGLAENENEIAEALKQLINCSLLDVSYTEGQVRYGIHQLTRQFIARDLPIIWKEQGLL